MRKVELRVMGALILFVALCGQLFAGQSSQAGPALPAFEVASVKLNRNPPNLGPRVMSLRLSLSHGTLTFEAYSLKNLILQAYDINASQLVGCPSWCDSDMFDVIAKTGDPNAIAEQVRPMLQTLLAERFGLAAHREKRELPGYALVVSKRGSRLKAAKDEETVGATATGYVRAFQKMPISGLVNFLAGAARQPVIDNTGLRGPFDFTIDLTPDNDAVPPNPINSFARLSAALEDQLGLTLEPRKILVENLVIEKAQRLSQN